MAVLQLGKFYPIKGGVEKVMRDLVIGLNANNIHCDMLCSMLPNDPIDAIDVNRSKCHNGVLTIDENGGHIIVVKALAKIAGTMISPALISYLRANKDKYEIIHIHHPDPMAALALRLSGYKGRVILHWHSDIVAQKVLYRLFLPIQKWLINRASHIVGTTPVYLKQSSHLKGYNQKFVVIPIGIEKIVFDRDRVKETKQRFSGDKLILSVGRLVPYKGFEYLIEAAEYLPDNYHIVIGGDGPLLPMLTEMVRTRHLESRVTLLGYISDDVRSDLYGACDAFVLSSVSKNEAFGIVQIEAMSCGKPVIATTIPESGTSWVNKPGVSGLNISPKDPEAIADAILTICKDQLRYSLQAKTLFEDRYEISNMIKLIIKLYEKERL